VGTPTHGLEAVQQNVAAGAGSPAVQQPSVTSYPMPSASVETPSTKKGGALIITNPGGYTVCRGSKSVRDVWNEWQVGLKGGPPVKKLEEQRREGKVKQWWASATDEDYWDKQVRLVPFPQSALRVLHMGHASEQARGPCSNSAAVASDMLHE